jgi:hypothetical protein
VTFKHAVGAASGNLAWTCQADDVAEAGLMLSGVCASLAAGKHTVHFRMGLNEVKKSTENLIGLEVKEIANGIVLASGKIPWNRFAAAGQPVDFQLTFTNAMENAPLDFQVYWYHVTNAPALTLSDVTVDGSHNWTAANLAHEVGRLDGLNGWEADPIRDHISGYLVKGPGANEFSTGGYSACFELKVDNFIWDTTKAATLSIVESDTGKVIASRDLTRIQFPNTLYQAFTLNFQAEAGKRYDFRTFWHYAPNAPRLTQRSLLVQPQTSN